MKNDIFYKSSDNKSTIHAIEWVPEDKPKAILQICHGMMEFIDRYDEFARLCAQRGYLVVGNDHLGHGLSAASKDDLGYFADKDGNLCLINDIDTLRKLTQEKYPGLPYILMGHSMGSFLARQYITVHGEGLAGCIIMGTGYYPEAVTVMGMQLCRVRAQKKGWHYRSKFMTGLCEGAYNAKFGKKGGFEWLTKVDKVIEEYVVNPLNAFTFTLNGYYNMLEGIRLIGKNENLVKMNKSMPVLFVSGEDDPVGDFGKGVKKVYNRFKSVGMKDVTLKLFETDRHEILNETDKESVRNYILNWMDSKTVR